MGNEIARFGLFLGVMFIATAGVILASRQIKKHKKTGDTTESAPDNTKE